MKRIYFACSIRGGRDDAATYGSLVSHLKTCSELLTEIFADQKLTVDGMNKPSADIWKIDTDWVKECDGLIAEVTNPSLGVGYEIAKAEEWGKPVLALFRKSETRKLSAMVDGSPDTQIVVYETIEEAESAISIFIQSLE